MAILAGVRTCGDTYARREKGLDLTGLVFGGGQKAGKGVRRGLNQQRAVGSCLIEVLRLRNRGLVTTVVLNTTFMTLL